MKIYYFNMFFNTALEMKTIHLNCYERIYFFLLVRYTTDQKQKKSIMWQLVICKLSQGPIFLSTL